MPELPEVETSRHGIEPYVAGQHIDNIVIRERRLRWPVSQDVDAHLPGQTVTSVGRRAKYLLLNTDNGAAIVHLGMSGSVFVVERDTPAGVHEHFDIEFSSGKALRFRDPRRFGSLHWSDEPSAHWLLKDLGPEPLSGEFTGQYLWSVSRGRRVSIKPFIMNASVVVGVGNIYANEALFRSRIHPRRAAGRISAQRFEALATSIKHVLDDAIRAGGTTLRDFVGGDGKPGYFQQTLAVYGRRGEPCIDCRTPIKQVVLGQRATYYCPHCQR